MYMTEEKRFLDWIKKRKSDECYLQETHVKRSVTENLKIKECTIDILDELLVYQVISEKQTYLLRLRALWQIMSDITPGTKNGLPRRFTNR